MDTPTIYHWMITCINAAIMVVLITSFRKHYLARKLDKNFHTVMLLLCTCLLLANTFAFITSVYSYFIYRIETPEVITFGRFADRYCMFFGYITLNKISDRY